jgi:hypothetical protein
MEPGLLLCLDVPTLTALTQKIRVGDRRTLYLSTHAARQPLELFVRRGMIARRR